MPKLKRMFEVETAISGAEVHVLEGHGIEELGRPFQYEFTLLCGDDLSLDDLLGKPLTVTIEDEAAHSSRYINGIVTKVAVVGRRGRFAEYTATIQPWLAVLTQVSDNKIFQEKDVGEILKEVFDKNGFSDYQFKTTGSYRKREFCVQYGETTFEFVSRLMEEEGIYYFFDHSDGKHDLIICDSSSGHAASKMENGDSLPFRDVDQNSLGVQHISQWQLRHALRTESFVIDSYNFEEPGKPLKQAESDPMKHAHSDLERYEYGQLWPEAKDGKALVKIRNEEQLTGYQGASGTCNAPGMACGHTFSLKEHILSSQDGEYLATRTHISFRNNDIENLYDDGGEYYVCQFSAIDSKRQFRSARKTRKGLVRGPQTAVVVGPSGEEIWTDEFGRVKLQFHWDRVGKKDENSSCWVRVATMWAGNKWGSISIPRIGQEVIVDFIEGDPDQPLITGSVYNAEQMPPFKLPENKTQSGVRTQSSKDGTGKTFNELRFEDKKNSEEIYFHAETDFNRVVENNDTLVVGASKKDKGDQTIDIHNDRTVTLEEGTDSLTVKKGDRVALVTKGDDKLMVDGGNQKIKVAKKISIEAGDELKIKVGMCSLTMKKNGDITIVGKNIKTDGKGKITFKALQDFSAEGLNAKIKGTIGAEVKGLTAKVEAQTMLDLKGSAMATLKGGITMIG